MCVCVYSMCVFMSVQESMFCMHMLYVVNVCLCDASVTGAELIAADGCRRVKTYIQHTDTGRRHREKRNNVMLQTECLLPWFNFPSLNVHQTAD